MNALLDVELRRAFARRLIRITTVILAGLILLILTIAFFRSSKPSTAPFVPREAIEDCVAGNNALLEPFVQSVPHDAQESFLAQLPPGSERRRNFCEQALQNPSFDASRDSRTFYLDELGGVLRGTSGMFVIVALVFGASLIGAEWRAGTVATQLTWEPRRVTVAVAKVTAAVITTLAVYLSLVTLLSFLSWLVAFTRGSTEGMGVDQAQEIVVQELRLSLLMAFAVMIGFSIGMVAKNTAATLGFAFGYFIVFEQILTSQEWLRPWLVLPNVVSFLLGSEVSDFISRSRWESGGTLAMYALLFLFIAVTIFKKRDALT